MRGRFYLTSAHRVGTIEIVKTIDCKKSLSKRQTLNRAAVRNRKTAMFPGFLYGSSQFPLPDFFMERKIIMKTIKKSQNKLTAAKKCYDTFSKKFPDCIIFFRMGDSYESFYDDAESCSQISGQPLTFRDKPEAGHVPLFSVPFYDIDNFVKKITKAGHKVAICEQYKQRDYIRTIQPN
jgi:hypothetical protein